MQQPAELGHGRPRVSQWLQCACLSDACRVYAVSTLIALAICVFGYITYGRLERSVTDNAQSELARISMRQAEDVANWHQKRIADAADLVKNPDLGRVLARWTQAGRPDNADAQLIRAWLGLMQIRVNYVAMTLLDEQGREVAVLSGRPGNSKTNRQSLALQAVAQRQVLVGELEMDTQGHLVMPIVAPLFDETTGAARAVGVLQFDADASRVMQRGLKSAALYESDIETLVVARDGDQIHYLSQTQLVAENAATSHLPLNTPNLVAALAVQGKAGLIRGADYRRQAVVAYAAAVPGSNWHVISKTSESVLYGPVRQLMLWAAGITALLVSAAFVVAWSLLQRNRELWQRHRLALEQVHLQGRIEDLSQFARELYILSDAGGHILEANDRVVQVYGYSREELLQMDGADLRAPEARVNFAANFQTILAERKRRYETVHKRKDGSTFPVEVSARTVQHGTTVLVQGLMRDISQHKASQEKLAFMSHHDALTGLPNRLLLLDLLGQAIPTANRNRNVLGLLCLGVDDFETLNEAHGHDFGSSVLVELASRMKLALREGDTLSHLAGDEFVVLLPDISMMEQATTVAQKLLKCMASPMHNAGQEIFVSISIGITLYPQDRHSADELLRHASAALHHARSFGRSSFQYYAPELTERAQRRIELEAGLRLALTRNELLLHYQPQVNLKTGVMTGVEALVRWLHPEKGLIPPDQFIPVAEASGLIVELGEWVLRTACAQAQAWQESGQPELVMAVNISSHQFRNGKLVGTVQSALRDTGLSPHLLELEMTESVLMDNASATVLSTLNELERMGVGLSIDDFGTGYSSLSYLKRFPIKKLKIDKSFVAGLPADAEDAALVSAIVALANSLQLKLIAEGVETTAQTDFLFDLGCYDVQGYYVSRPLPADVVSEMIQNTAGLVLMPAQDTQTQLLYG